MRKFILVLLILGIIISPLTLGVHVAAAIDKTDCQQTTFSSVPTIYGCLITIGLWDPAEAVRATCTLDLSTYETCMANAGPLGLFGLCRDAAYDNAGDAENDLYLAGLKACLVNYVNSLPEPSCIDVPDGSVVGSLPNTTQVFYEPGNISPQLFLNPGTYIVVGQDKSESYYEIVLACQFLWVSKDAMQPSFEAPQNSTPLPTRIVG